MGRSKISRTLLRNFHKELEKISRKETCDMERAFIHWYINAKYTPRKFEITDGDGDGFIDAVAWLDDHRYVVLQSKYNNGYNSTHRQNGKLVPDTKRITPDQYQPFDTKTIPAFKNDVAYNRWLQRENVRANVRPIYKEIFDMYQNDDTKVTFEFITTHYPPTKRQKKLVNLERKRTFKAFDEIFYLFDQYEQKTLPEAEPLELDVLDSFIVNDTLYDGNNDPHDIDTLVTRVRALDLVNYMQSVPDPSYIISRNVRDFLVGKKKGTGSDINENLKKTYETQPEQFWYSHNGITMICRDLDDANLQNSTSGKITIHSPNIINGAQTVRTLEKVTKRNIDATLLAKIFRISPSKLTDELIQNVITRANQQNAIFPRDLRANEKIMHKIQEWFGDRSVFFERRRGDKNNYKLPVSTNPYYISKVIMVSKYPGGDGVLKSKENKEEVFKSDSDFKDIFINNLLPDVYFMFIVRKLLLDPIFKSLSKQGKGYLQAPVNGIIWDAIKRSGSRKFASWKDKVNHDQNLFSFKKQSSLTSMKVIVRDIIDIVDKIIMPGNRSYVGKYKYRLFIDKKDGKKSNDDLLTHCKTDTGQRITNVGFTSGKRVLIKSRNIKSQGIMKDVTRILTEHFDRWDNCPDCGKYTDMEKPACIHCNVGECPSCNQLTSYDGSRCVQCNQRL